MLGYKSESLEIADLPIVPANMRATVLYASMKAAMRRWSLRIGTWRPRPGSGWNLAYRLLRLNASTLAMIMALASTAAVLFYVPNLFLLRTVRYIEEDKERVDKSWGWVYAAGLFFSHSIVSIGEFSISE